LYFDFLNFVAIYDFKYEYCVALLEIDFQGFFTSGFLSSQFRPAHFNKDYGYVKYVNQVV